MSIFGMAIMWGFAIVAFIIIANWPMGKVCDKRTEYWKKFEGK